MSRPSAAALGVTILSKGIATLVGADHRLPDLGRGHHASQQWLAMIEWLSIIGSIVSLDVLIAALRGRTLFHAERPLRHVSMGMSGLPRDAAFQTARGSDSEFFSRPVTASGRDTRLRPEPSRCSCIVGTAASVASLAFIHSKPGVGGNQESIVLSLSLLPWDAAGSSSASMGSPSSLPGPEPSAGRIIDDAIAHRAESGRLSSLRIVARRRLRAWLTIGAALALIVTAYPDPVPGTRHRDRCSCRRSNKASRGAGPSS